MDSRPIGVVVNPAAALGAGRRAGERVISVLAELGYPTVRISGRTREACERAIAGHSAGVRAFVLVGGDGLLSLFINVAAARGVPFGIVPAGSGNDFSRQFGVPRNARAAVLRILGALDRPTTVDAAVVRTPGTKTVRWFAGGLSIGFDAEVNRRANAIKLPLGPLRYQLALVTEIARHRPTRFRVEVRTDAVSEIRPEVRREVREFTGVLATVMNIRTLGGGIPITPTASAVDGLLDVIMIEAVPRMRMLGLLTTLARGKHVNLPEVEILRGDTVQIDTDAVGFADGEHVGYGPFAVRIAPGALSVLV